MELFHQSGRSAGVIEKQNFLRPLVNAVQRRRSEEASSDQPPPARIFDVPLLTLQIIDLFVVDGKSTTIFSPAATTVGYSRDCCSLPKARATTQARPTNCMHVPSDVVSPTRGGVSWPRNIYPLCTSTGGSMFVFGENFPSGWIATEWRNYTPEER